MVNLWRFIGGIGIGVELVTIDTLHLRTGTEARARQGVRLPAGHRLRAVPLVALLAWLLVPADPLGFSGWRWVVLIGSVGAVFIWWLRLGLPGVAALAGAAGPLAEAEQVMQAIETQVAAESRQPLPTPELAPPEDPRAGQLLGGVSPAYRVAPS